MTSNDWNAAGSRKKTAETEATENGEDESGDEWGLHRGFIRLEGTHTTATCTDGTSIISLPSEDNEVKDRRTVSFKEDADNVAKKQDPVQPSCSTYVPDDVVRDAGVSPVNLNQFISLFDTLTKVLASKDSSDHNLETAERTRSLVGPEASVSREKTRFKHARELHAIIDLPLATPIPLKATATVASQCSRTQLVLSRPFDISEALASQPDRDELYSVEHVAHRAGGDVVGLEHHNSEGSGFTLAKVSESLPTLNEFTSHRRSSSAAPCERTFHTLHIEAASSPSSSIMRRAPLHLRLWAVVTDFFRAICVCLQVNRDCIFCVGFFVAFVVSASFLTAFFYRTLSSDPQTYQQQSDTQSHHRLPPQPRIDRVVLGTN